MNVKYVAYTLVGLAIAAILIHVALLLLYIYFTGQNPLGYRETTYGREDTMARRLKAVFPKPRLQIDPSLDYRELRQQQLAELNRYTWKNQELGLVQIPIDRAIALIAERGLPYWQSQNAVPPPRTPLQMIYQRAQEPTE